MIFSSILVDNILTAPVIAFVVALIATLLRFDLRIPDALYPILSTFLLLAIGIKGGKALSESSPAELSDSLQTNKVESPRYLSRKF